MKRPLTRPSATLSPQGRGNGCLALSFSHAEAIGSQSSPSPLRGEGWGEGSFCEFL